MIDGTISPSEVRQVRVSSSAVLAVVAVAQFMVVLDASVVNVALPSIQRDVGFSEQSLSWVLNAYTLLFGGFLLLGGRAADRLGRRRLFMAGIALFTGASLACGLSQSEATLLIARGAQGLGGALVSPAALSIILTTFAEGSERNRALAIWGAIAGAGGAGGLLLGGAIVELLSWRWVFFVNVPIGAAVLLLAPRILPESRTEGVRSGYDLEGATAITLGTMALVFTLIKANDWGWGSGRTLAGMAAAVALLAGFVWIEHRHENPLVPLRIFTNRSLAASDATMLLLAAALFGLFYFCTLYLQQVLGYNALMTGVAYLPFSFAIIASSGVASRVADRVGPKPVLVGGLLLATVGFALFTRLQAHGDYAGTVLPAMLVMGVGLGMSFVPITIAATSGVAAEDSGLASGLLNTTQQVGGSLGLAVLSAVSTSRITSELHGGSTLLAALTHGFTGAFTVSAILCAVAAVVAVVLLPGRRRDAEDVHVETVAMSFARVPRRAVLRPPGARRRVGPPHARRGGPSASVGRPGSGHPGLGERRQLQFVGRGARSLPREEHDGVGELTWVREPGLVDARAAAAVKRRDAGIDDQQRDVQAVLAQFERGGLGDRSDAECAGCPQPASGHRATRGAAGDLDQRRRPALVGEDRGGAGQERERRAAGRNGPRVEGVRGGRGDRAASERPGARAAVRRRGVDHEVDAAVGRRRCRDRGAHAGLIGDVRAQGQRARGRDALERRLRPRGARDGPALGDQGLDDRLAQVARAEDHRAWLRRVRIGRRCHADSLRSAPARCADSSRPARSSAAAASSRIG
jgi:EmrB/QacA subfamily drug resistance transporter